MTEITSDSAKMMRSLRPDIQALRGLSVLSVALFHADLSFPGGFAGVDIFFVISGYVITQSLIQEGKNFDFESLRRFWVRRFFRLAPSALTLVAITSLASIFILDRALLPQVSKVAQGAIFGLANFTIALTSGGYFDPDTALNPLLHTWSLSVEDQFYIVLPLLILLWAYVHRRGKQEALKKFLVFGLVSLAVTSICATLLNELELVTAIPKTLTGFYSPISRSWEFLVGCLAAFVTIAPAKRTGHVANYLIIASTSGLLISFFALSNSLPTPGFQTLLPVLSSLGALVGFSIRGDGSWLPPSLKPLVWLGDRSYSVYLWHWPLLVLGTNAFGGGWLKIVYLAISLVFAEANYRLVETRFRYMYRDQVSASQRRNVAFKFSALACLSVAALSVSAPVIAAPSGNLSKSENAGDFVRCTDNEFSPADCTFNGSNQHLALLVGDSQASAMATGIIQSLKSMGYRTLLSSRSGCPFLMSDTTGTKELDCPAWQSEILRYISLEKPELLVVANRSSGYTNLSPTWRTFTGPGGPAKSATVDAMYGSALREMMRSLTPQGIKVVLIQNIPEPHGIPTNNSLFHLAFPQQIPKNFEKETSWRRRERAAKVERNVDEENRNLYLFDPYSALCRQSLCTYRVGKNFVYADPNHLSPYGSRLLSTEFAAQVGSFIRQ
jgi:peptidoglycan/LPS O-acetylase OafA/YrhL